MAREIYGKSKNLTKSFYKKLLIIAFAGLLMSFSLNYFILPLGILSAGFGGLAQGISYTLNAIIKPDNPDDFLIISYWIVIFVANIPVSIFAYFYYGKNLFYLSLWSFFVMLLSSFFFGFVPGFKDAGYISSTDPTSVPDTLVLSLIGGTLYGIGTGLVFLQGGTSLGADPISRYLGREKGYNFSKIIFIGSIFLSFFWIFVIKLIDTPIESFKIFVTEILFSPEIIGSLTFIISYSLIVGYVYPTSRKYLVEINSKKVNQISEKLISMNYHRGHSIEEVVGGYTKEKRSVLKILINSEEFNDIVDIVEGIDSEAFLYATRALQAYSKNHVWVPETMEDKSIKRQKIERHNQHMLKKSQRKNDSKNKKTK